jgi:hypothetical protein
MKIRTNTGYELSLDGSLDFLDIKSETSEKKTIHYKNIKKVETNLPDKLDELIIKKDDKSFSTKLFIVLFSVCAIVLIYFMTQSTESTGRYTMFQDDYDKAVSGYTLGYEKKENYTSTYRWISGILAFIFLLFYYNDKKELKNVSQKVEDANLKVINNHNYELSIIGSNKDNPEIISGTSSELISISKQIRNNIKLYNERERKKQKELQKNKK